MGAFARAVQRPVGTFCIVTTAMTLVIFLNFLNTIATREAAGIHRISDITPSTIVSRVLPDAASFDQVVLDVPVAEEEVAPGNEQDQTPSKAVEESVSSKIDPFELEEVEAASTSPIPKLIHQIWWQSPNPADVSTKYKPWMQTWLSKNPNHVHNLWNGTRSDDFIAENYVPRVYNAWKRLPLMVQRTDFLRYALMISYGGLFTDMDTECLRGVDEWRIEQWPSARVFVGKEWNTLPFNPIKELQTMSIGSWTLMSPPRHPLFRLALTKLITKIEAAENSTLHSVADVVPFGGPMFFTGVLSEYLGGLSDDVGHPENHDDSLKKDVMVFEVTRFNPTGPRAMGVASGRALVLHHFTSFHVGGWRSERPDVHLADRKRKRRVRIAMLSRVTSRSVHRLGIFVVSLLVSTLVVAYLNQFSSVPRTLVRYFENRNKPAVAVDKVGQPHGAAASTDAVQTLFDHDIELTPTDAQSHPRIPKIIHQIWWQTPHSTSVPAKYHKWLSTWTTKNPSHIHKLWNGTNADDFLRKVFTSRVYEAWTRLPLWIQRTDFLRYALLWYYGGVFADLDTECLVGVDEWGIGEWSGANVFIGKEWNADPTDGNPQFLNMSIGSWTVVAVPGHELYKLALSLLVARIEVASNESLHSIEDVVPLGGPAFFTSVLELYLGGKLIDDVGRPDNNDDSVKRDVVVFEVTRFNPNGHRAKGAWSGRALVQHHFTNAHEGGWKSKKPSLHLV